MKFVLRLVLLLCLGLPALADENSHYPPLWQKQKPNITDLALIYQGGTRRPQWTTERFAPYVTYRDLQSGKEHWLFDGFLLIEFIDGQGHAFQPMPNSLPAQKTHWQALIDKNFSKNDGVPNLEEVCREATARIGSPLRPRQVVLTIPVPVEGQTNWGTINGRTLDFHKTEDRLAAVDWYLDEALRQWKTLAPKHLELAGFYWVHESFPRSTNYLTQVARLVHARGQQFFWIPYWHWNTAPKNWRSLDFDIAWQQPNHFFHPEVPDSRLDEACAFAKKYGLGLEFECDGRMIDDPAKFERRFDAYLDTFEKLGVKTNSSIAYYEGGGALYRLAKSDQARMRAHYDRIAKFIVDRQRLADALAK